MNLLDPASKILAFIGPSGSGKSSIIHRLVADGVIEVTPTWTTREPRPGELEYGLEHMFVSDAVYDALDATNFFLETVQLFDLPPRYGMPRITQPPTGKVPAVMLRSMVLPLLPAHYPNHLIYQIEDELVRVRERLAKRAEQGEDNGARLASYESEVEHGHKVAHRIFVNNSTLDEAVANISQAIRADFYTAPRK